MFRLGEATAERASKGLVGMYLSVESGPKFYTFLVDPELLFTKMAISIYSIILKEHDMQFCTKLRTCSVMLIHKK